MHARALFAVVVLSTTLFSGCLGGDDEGGPAGTTSGTTDSSSPATTPTTGGGQPGSGANHAPDVVVKVLQNGAEAVLANGSYPVQSDSNVTLDASGTSDPEGAELTFAWTLNGTQLDTEEAVVEVRLAAGNHTVELVVSDGAEESSLTMALVSAAAVSGGGPVGDAAIVTLLTGSFKQGDDDAATVKKPFEVPAGAQQLSIWVTWDDGVLGNSPLLVDIDVFVMGPNGKDVVAAESTDFEFVRINDPEVLVPGLWQVRLLPYGDAIAGAPAIPVDTDYTVKVIVWMAKPSVKEFKGTVAGGIHLGTAADTANKVHDLELANGPGAISARLTWTNAASANAGSAVRRTNDYDLSVKVAGKTVMSSGNGFATEFASLDAEPMKNLAAGKWTFEVIPFQILTADYVLTVEYA